MGQRGGGKNGGGQRECRLGDAREHGGPRFVVQQFRIGGCAARSSRNRRECASAGERETAPTPSPLEAPRPPHGLLVTVDRSTASCPSVSRVHVDASGGPPSFSCWQHGGRCFGATIVVSKRGAAAECRDSSASSRPQRATLCPLYRRCSPPSPRRPLQLAAATFSPLFGLQRALVATDTQRPQVK
ncbi:hypothetical protein KM043_003658 [Ampulex compressa]|nr:hypothetical protein KM043_003658 [Ampulex compressa]